MKRWLLAAFAALVATGAFAQGTPPAAPTEARKGASPAKGATLEQDIAARAEQRLGVKPDSVRRAPVAGLFELVVENEVVYVDAQVNYVFAGRLIDTRTREDLTQARRDELLKVDYAKLPLNQAIKLVSGNGSRQFVTFEDPNCPYCKKLHRDLRGLKDATIYVFLYPILSKDSFDRARAIWCAKDPAAAWNDWMLEAKAPPAPAEDCKHPLQQNLALGQRMDISGTPTLIFQDGSRLPGAVPLEQIEQKFAKK